MVDEHEVRRHRARALSRALYDRSKRWWWTSLACKVSVFVVGTIVVLWAPGWKSSAVLIFLIYLASELALLRSDSFKGRAETIVRKLDFEESFDWKISGAELYDYELRSPKRLRKNLPTTASNEKYFASTEAFGPRRAAENVVESSSWSKHLAEKMGHLCLGITCVLVIGSIVILVVSIDSVQNISSLSNIGRLVTSALMLVFSLGLLKLMLGYYGFSEKAEKAEQAAENLLKGDCGERDAIKVLHDYQVARATAPLLPTQLWKRMRDDLNERWKRRQS
jgi:hypothetical protein